MMKDIKFLMGADCKKLILPICLSVLDSLLNSVMYGVMLLTLAALYDGSFSAAMVMRALLWLLGIFVLRCIFQGVAFTDAQCLGANASGKLRLRLGNHIRKLHLGYFNNHSIGRLNGVLTTDVTDYETIITHCLCDVVKVASFGILSVGFLFYIHPAFGLVTLVVCGLAVPVLFRSGKASGDSATRLKQAKSNVVTRLIEYISGIKTFRLYNLTGARFVKLDRDLKGLRDASTKSELSVLPLSLGFYIITAMLIPISIIFGGYLQMRGEITAAQFVLVMFVTVSLVDLLGVLSSLYPQIRSITKATENVREVLDETPFGYDPAVTKLDNFDIAYEDVHFSYNGKQEVLGGVSFTAKAGTTTALIGPSGSGKTTITSLLSRFWDVTGGRITIGGRDIREISPDLLASNMAIVFQDVYLLNDTIYNNIRIGKPDATEEEVYAAAKAACAHAFILAQPDGYQTMLSEGGGGLSGGEKQRISIARALLKDAPIVLLDETTSNLDADNEQEINRAFRKLMKHKTVLVIAHKLGTIRRADQILVLKDGKIYEEGNHETLLAQGGWYADVCREQEAAKTWQIS
ncbi:MAG: ABC transporter ATP-binding protein/permease [Lachnospiraceae bacterium]|nr:ABC transporter ATP-binding protein/permease [Lachnospiraceae bacterium]